MENLAVNNNSDVSYSFDNDDDSGYYVQKKLTKYLKDNNLHELPESLFNLSLRECPRGYKILDFLPEENFGNKGFYRFLMLKVKDLNTGNIYKYPMQINENSRERYGILYIPKMGDKFAFVNEFRMGAGDFVLNFPRGYPEKIDNILREFFEEVSNDFDWNKMKIKKVTESLEASSSSFNNSEFYLLEYEGDTKSIKFGGDEKNQVVLLSEKEVDEKILEGKIHDNFTLAAWGYYKAKVSQERNKKTSILSLIKKFFS